METWAFFLDVQVIQARNFAEKGMVNYHIIVAISCEIMYYIK